MNIPFSILKQIAAKVEKPEFSKLIQPVNQAGSDLPLFKTGYKLCRHDIKDLEKCQADNINLAFTINFLTELNSIDPEQYRLPYAVKNYYEFDKMQEMTAEINKTSGRKRTVFHCGELYKNAEEGNYNIQLAWNEEITAEKWNSLKRTIPRTSRIAYRFNEYKIIILVDLRPAGDDYIKRFYKNSDLVTTLVNRKKGSNIRISPDFNRLTDVVTVEDPSRLLAVYQESCARLVIVGDALSEIYQKALAEVKRYDRYARFMLAVNIDQAKIDYFLSQIKLNYHRNNW